MNYRHTILLLAALISAACTDIYDNIREFGDEETVYVGMLDGVQLVKTGFERLEFDLWKEGRVPAGMMKVGRASKTLIVCEDFTEPDHTRIIDSLCSWVNITGLTELKNYQFTIYTADKYGNRSLPLSAEGTPYTQENLDALAIVQPSVIESENAAYVRWSDPMSTDMYRIFDYIWEYTDRDGESHSGHGAGDTPSFLVENVENGVEVPIKMTCTTLPCIAAVGSKNYRPILDTVTWKTSVSIMISKGAEPTIFLKGPSEGLSMASDNLDEAFPLSFSWTKVPSVSNYLLKLSVSPDFSISETLSIETGNVDEYVMTAEQALLFIGSLQKKRLMTFYWTVVPVDESISAATEVRSFTLENKPRLTGNWLFNDTANLLKAAVGTDLSAGAGNVSAIEGPAGSTAARISGGTWLKCDHGVSSLGSYTIVYKVRFQARGQHNLLQTNPDNTDASELRVPANGRLGIDGLGDADAWYTAGPGCWHEFAIVADDGNYTLFIDGEAPVKLFSNDSRYKLSAKGCVLFGSGTGNDLDIDVAEVAVYDMPLLPEEIIAHDRLVRVPSSSISVASASENSTKPDAVCDGVRDDNYPWEDVSKSNNPISVVLDLGESRQIKRICAYSNIWMGSGPKTISFGIGDSPSLDGAFTSVGEITRSGAGYNPWGNVFQLDLKDAVAGKYLRIDIPECYACPHLNEVSLFETVD